MQKSTKVSQEDQFKTVRYAPLLLFVMLGFVVFFIVPQPEGASFTFDPFAFATDTDNFVPIFLSLSCAVFFPLYYLSSDNSPLYNSGIDHRPGSMKYMVLLALSELPVLLGFVSSFTAENPLYYIPFALIALVIYIYANSRVNELILKEKNSIHLK